jgi:hypothetical protein
MDSNYVLGGDLNPILGSCFPLFSMVYPREVPLGWKVAEKSGSKTVVNCSQSTYTFSTHFNLSRPLKQRFERRLSGFQAFAQARLIRDPEL